jgi:glycosyltransferase involved in cell wall biosynthesis
MISVSHAVAAAVERSEGYPRSRAQVIWNGEELHRFFPGRSPLRESFGVGPGTLVLGSVSLFSPIKDIGTQIEAVARLSRDRPDVCLVLAGFGPERADLERRAAPLGERVRIIGRRDDVPEVLRACDVYLCSSLSEGLSNSIVQAMATGLPVVATRVGGNPELLGEACGLLVPPADAGAMAAALGRLAADPGLRLEMGRAARLRAERLLRFESMVEAYQDAFDRAVEGRFPGPSSGEGPVRT